MEQRIALVTGITGQDGSYLAELLLSEGYTVHGIVRRTSTVSTSRISHILNQLTLHSCDLLDQGSLTRIVRDVRPSHVYNLASQSFVPTSWQQPILTAEVTALGCCRVLEAIITNNLLDTRFYQASTSEMFGKAQHSPQTEDTPFHPRSPYGVAKCYAHYITQNYRETHSLYACSGILFNHESPRRGIEFVTRKITRAVADIKKGLQSHLKLGSLDARRDWGHARDYVRAMYFMMIADSPKDYVVATNKCHSVEEFVQHSFECAELDWHQFVITDESLKRPAEVWTLQGCYDRIHKDLGWQPLTSFTNLISEMVEADINQSSST